MFLPHLPSRPLLKFATTTLLTTKIWCFIVLISRRWILIGIGTSNASGGIDIWPLSSLDGSERGAREIGCSMAMSSLIGGGPWWKDRKVLAGYWLKMGLRTVFEHSYYSGNKYRWVYAGMSTRSHTGDPILKRFAYRGHLQYRFVESRSSCSWCQIST